MSDESVELPGEMWGITTCFNPAGYDNKYDHLRRFSAAIRTQGLKLLVVELALRGQEFRLADDVADKVIRITSDTVLWHKERLLNLAIQALPAECDKVAWVDADLLFENANWVSETSELLERYVMVQPYQHYCLLPRDVVTLPGPEGVPEFPGLAFARTTGDAAYVATALPGGAWAARRSLLERHGIYDRFVLGGGDAALGWAMYGDTEKWLSEGWFSVLLAKEVAGDLREWSAAFYEDVKGSVSYTPGRIFHLWHGDMKQRRYVLRFMILRDAGFDPAKDIALDSQGCWRWSSDKPELHRKVEDYFRARKEEG